MKKLTRRRFIELSGAAAAATAAAGLLAGCGPQEQRAVAPTPAGVTTEPSSEEQGVVVPVAANAPSKVVQVHHANLWDSGELAPAAVRQALDAAITELVGLESVVDAWATLFDPGERIAIKVNTLIMGDHTHPPLVVAVTDSLQEAGIPAEQIVIFDRTTGELRRAGYPVNEDGPGVCCHGTSYTPGWEILDTQIKLSDVLLGCDALINMPILTGIVFFGAGITFAMKNHFGTFDRPQDFHEERFAPGVVELNALSPIGERTRLVIGDILTPETYRSYHGRYVIGGDGILMSLDPVAHDSVGAQIAAEGYAAEGQDPAVVVSQAATWLDRAAELGLGTNDLENIDWTEVNLE